MRRAFLASVVLVLIAIVVAGLAHAERRAFSLGVTSSGTVGDLRHGQEVCQTSIDVPRGGAFDAVRLPVGSRGTDGSRLVATVRSQDGRHLARGVLVAPYADAARAPYQVIDVGHVDDDQRISVCLRNAGARRIGLYGNTGEASPCTGARNERGRLQPYDLELVFLRRDSRPQLAIVPDMVFRAQLFKPGWLGAPTRWLVLALVIAGVSFALWRALRASEAPDSRAR
jgi:hypothetical protein